MIKAAGWNVGGIEAGKMTPAYSRAGYLIPSGRTPTKRKEEQKMKDDGGVEVRRRIMIKVEGVSEDGG